MRADRCWRRHSGCHNQVCKVGGMSRKARIFRREFVKLHIVTDVRGRKIVSCAVTRGLAHDSPVFREMIKRVPDGA